MLQKFARVGHWNNAVSQKFVLIFSSNFYLSVQDCFSLTVKNFKYRNNYRLS
jgi:hypothetical protein